MTKDFASSLAAAEEEAFLVGRTSAPTVAGHNGTGANDTNLEKIQTTTNIWAETGTAALNGVAGYNYDKTANLICDGIVSVGLDSGNVIDAGGDSFYGTTAYTLLRQAINQLGVLGRNKKDLALIINPVASSQLLMSTELMTLEKYGRDATIITGEVGQLFGVKVLESTFLPSGTGNEVDSAGDETGGTYTGASQVYGLGGIGVLVHVPSVMVGDRRKVSISTEEVLEYDAFRTVLTSRVAFGVERSGCVSVIGNLDADVGLEE